MDYTPMPQSEAEISAKERPKVFAVRDVKTGRLRDFIYDGYSPIPTTYNERSSVYLPKNDTSEIVEISKPEDWEYRECEKTKNTLTEIFWDRMFARYQFIKTARSDPNHPARHHHAYVSTKDPTQIAFTPSAEYGRRDRQVTMRPGRYLAKFYGDLLTPGEIVKLTDKWTNLYVKSKLKFAVTAAEIVDVYFRGPNSCMSKPLTEYEGSEHPVSAYGDSDLQCAYVEDGDRVTARVIVWPEKKLYVRAYGHETRLLHELCKLEYQQANSFHGARLRAVPNTNSNEGWCIPYVDGYIQRGTLTYDEKYIEINECGDIELDVTDGCTNEGGVICENCDERISEDNSYTIHISRNNTQIWCADCRDHEGFYCSETGDSFSSSNFTCVEVNGQDVCFDMCEDRISVSNRTDNYYWTADAVKVFNSSDPEDYDLDDPSLMSDYDGYGLWTEVRNGKRVLLDYNPEEDQEELDLEPKKDVA